MTMPFDDEWGRPVDGSGDFARVEQLQEHLVIVFPVGYIQHSPTRFTVPGKKSDVIVSDVIDLDDVDEYGNPGKVYRTAWWRQSQLIMSLRPWIGKRVLGRIRKGISRNGMNPPWIIADATPEPASLDRARAWAHAHPDFALSPFSPPPEPYQDNTDPWTTATPERPPTQPLAPPPPQYQQAPQQYQQGPPPQQYPPQGPPPQYQQPAPQYQQPAQYPQQGPPPQYQQPQQELQRFPVGEPAAIAQAQEGHTLQLMRAERERREAGQPYQDSQPPF